MKKHLLDQDAPGLTTRLRSLHGDRQHEMLARTSLFTATKLSHLSKTATEVLEELRIYPQLSLERAQAIMRLSEAADEKYFLLRGQAVPDDDWGNAFSEARLLRGIAVGFGASPEEDIADAIYELIKAVDDPQHTLQFIESELNANRGPSCFAKPPHGPHPSD